MKNLFWVFTNVYGKLFGWPFLRKFHHAIVTGSLHALGYGNMYRESWTGEGWFLERVLQKKHPQVIFDVGANVGKYSQLLKDNFDAEIFAFEPNPKAFEKLQSVSGKVSTVQAAVSDNDGAAVLHFQSDTDVKASLDSKVRGGQQVQVKTFRLDTFCRENAINHIDFLKIDTEGFEKEVIDGLGELQPSFIQFEFNINHLQRNVTLLEITDLLPDYKFYRLLPHSWLQIDPKKYLNNIFMFSNYIAVRLD